MFRISMLLLGAALLAGCASAPEATIDRGREAGTQLPVASHGRHVRFVGNQTYRQDNEVRSLGNEVGIRGN